MSDQTPGNFVERRQYKRYKLELICGDQAVRNDLDFLRIAEEGAKISIMPIGETMPHKSIKFIVQRKAFHEIDYISEVISSKAYNSVDELIECVKHIAGSGQPSLIQKSLQRSPLIAKFGSADGTYKILPTASGHGNMISDKFKINPGGNSKDKQ